MKRTSVLQRLGIALLATTVLLSACGKRTEEVESSASAPQFGANGEILNGPPELGAAVAEDLTVRISSNRNFIPTGGNEVALITVYVTNDRNQAVPDQEVELSANGGVLQGISATTDTNGEASATLSLAGDYRNGDIEISARVGRASGSVVVQASGTTLDIVGENRIVAGEDAQLTAVLVAGNGEPIVNREVMLASAVGHPLSVESAMTDTSGEISFTVAELRSDDEISLSAFDGTVSARQRVTLVDPFDPANQLAIHVTSDRSVIPTGGGEVAAITAHVTNSSNQAVAGQTVELTANGGILRSISTLSDENGEASAVLDLSDNYRNRSVTVTASIGDNSHSVVVQSAGTGISLSGPESVEPGADAPLRVVLSAGNGDPIPNQPLQYSSVTGNTIVTRSAITDAAGEALLTVSGVQSDDEIRVTAFDGSVSATHSLSLIDAEQIPSLDVRLISDRSFIRTGTGEVATIRALVTNERNQAVEAQAVDFRATGGVLRDIAAQTDANGEATATLGLARDFHNRDIEVTVSADGVSKSVQVQATGSGIDIAGPAALVTGNTARLVATLTSGNDEPIANRELSFSSSAGNVITPASAVTDSAGRVSVDVTTTNGDDTIFASALDGSVVGSHEFTVASDLLSFAADLDGAELEVGMPHPVSVVWESQGQPVDNQPLRFGITTGRITAVGDGSVTDQALTDADGAATVNVSSSSAGPATITVEALNGGDPATRITVEFVARQAADIALESSNSRVQTGSQSTLTARVTDASGNPVKGSVVRFNSDDLRGGSLTPASAVTDSAGIARVVFTAGDLPTEVNAIMVNAAVEGAATLADTLLTIVERQLNITLGTSTEIFTTGGGTQYRVPFVVQVADGSGAPLTDATVDVSLHPVRYYKGRMVLADQAGRTDASLSGFEPKYWAIALAGEAAEGCASEDIDRDRQIDPGEDINNNDALDPQDPALVVIGSGTSGSDNPSSLKTDTQGSGYFDLIYPQSNALWATVEVTARARAFNAESIATFITTLPLPAEEATDVKTSPPNVISPYGSTGGCDVAGDGNG